MNGTEVASAKEAADTLKAEAGKDVRLYVTNVVGSRFVLVKPGDAKAAD